MRALTSQQLHIHSTHWIAYRHMNEVLEDSWLRVVLTVHLPLSHQHKPTEDADSARLNLLLHDVEIHMNNDPAHRIYELSFRILMQVLCDRPRLINDIQPRAHQDLGTRCASTRRCRNKLTHMQPSRRSCALRSYALLIAYREASPPILMPPKSNKTHERCN